MKNYQNNSERFGELGVIVTEEEMIQQIRYFTPMKEESAIKEEIRRAVISGELIEL